jgi:diaminopimelate dehydrogenase
MPIRLAIVGFGTLGKACARLAAADPRLQVAGFVRRAEQAGTPLPAPFHAMKAVAHVSELGQTDVALVCVPASAVMGVAHDLIQRKIPMVECAALHGTAFDDQAEDIRRLASHHRVAAVVGAGWDPGALSLVRGLFAALIPKGHTEFEEHAGIHTHHTTLEQSIPGVKRAMSTEVRTSDGKLQRYVYVEPEAGADLKSIEAHIRGDATSLGVETFVFPLDEASAPEDEERGVLLRRHGASAGSRQFLLFEARISEATLAAQMMLAAAVAIPWLERRCYTVFELPASALSGAPSVAAWRQQWV